MPGFVGYLMGMVGLDITLAEMWIKNQNCLATAPFEPAGNPNGKRVFVFSSTEKCRETDGFPIGIGLGDVIMMVVDDVMIG